MISRDMLMNQSHLSPPVGKGTTGQWNEFFNHEIEELYQDVANDRLSVYGYQTLTVVMHPGTGDNIGKLI